MLTQMIPDPRPHDAAPPVRPRFRKMTSAEPEPPPEPAVPPEQRGARFYRDLLERVRREGEDRPGGQALLRHAGCASVEELRQKADDEDRRSWSAERVAADAAAQAAREQLEVAERKARAAAQEDARREAAQKRLAALRKRLAQLRVDIEEAKGFAADAARQLTQSLATPERAADPQELQRRSTLAYELVENRLMAGEVLPDAIKLVEQEIRALENENFGGSAAG